MIDAAWGAGERVLRPEDGWRRQVWRIIQNSKLNLLLIFLKISKDKIQQKLLSAYFSLSRCGDKCPNIRYFNIGYDHMGMTYDLNCLSPCIFEKVTKIVKLPVA